MKRITGEVSWRKKGAGYLPPLPNSNSDHRTATTTLIDLHYSNQRIAERWTWDRFQRLCSFLKVTEYELASLVLCPHDWVPRLKEHNRIPCSVHGGGRAVAMLLTILESKVLKQIVSDVIDDPMPDLGQVLKEGP